RGGEPLGAPPPVQFSTEFDTGSYERGAYDSGPVGGESLDGGAFAEDDWNLGAELGRREPPTKEFRLRLRRGADAIWVEVFDSDMRLPRIRSAGETDEGGRGLYLVDQLASRRGARPTADGKAAWVELPLAPGPAGAQGRRGGGPRARRGGWRGPSGTSRGRGGASGSCGSSPAASAGRTCTSPGGTCPSTCPG